MGDPTRETLSELLVRLRKSRLLSREALARASGVGYGTIRDLERGVARAPHMSTIKRLANGLGLEGQERSGFEAVALSGARPPEARTRASSRGAGAFDRGRTATTGADAGSTEPDGAELADAGSAGAASADIGSADAGQSDTGSASTGQPDTGQSDTGQPDTTGYADMVAASLLPHDIGSFTGRQDELRRLVTGARAGLAHAATGLRSIAGIFVIEGMGGVGKTTLAVHAAHQLADEFPDGQLFLDLQGHSSETPALTANQALRSLLRALGVPNELIPPGRPERETFYRNTVAGKRMLLICDNATSAAQVRPLIPGTGQSLVIITSRTSLRSLDDARVLTLHTPPEDEAISLFHAVAGADRDDPEDDEVAEVVRLCGCLPLAVRIVAARLTRRPALRVADVLHELRHEHDRLASLQDEERSVTAVFESSLRSLADPDERLLFQRLSLIPGPDFDVYAAASLSGTGYRETWRLLESLLDHNLLIQRIHGRYRFHDLVRVFARTHGVPGAAQVTSSLLNYYLRAARLADQAFERGLSRVPLTGEGSGSGGYGGIVPDFTTSAQAKAWLAAELTNLNAAAHLAASRKRPDVTIGLSAALSDYLRAHGPWPRALALHGAALRAATEVRDARGQANALRGIGGVLSRTGEIRRSVELLSKSVDIYRQLGDRRGAARALIELGIAQRVSGDANCLATFTEALTEYQELGDRHGQAAALNELGSVRWQTGPITEARRHLTDALSIYRELGNRQGQAAALLYLGNVQLVMGELNAAESSLTEAGVIGRELGQPVLVANSQLYLGDVQRAAGLFDDAEKSLNSALKGYTELSHRQGMATALAYLGKTLLQSSSGETNDHTSRGMSDRDANVSDLHRRAERSLAAALEMFDDLGDRSGKAETLNAYAAVALATGKSAAARERYEQALRLAEEVESARDKAEALSGLAAISAAADDIPTAVTRYREALALYQSMQADADVTRVRYILARLGPPEARRDRGGDFRP
ncbi:MAG TPA: tetratricopeptide repeat protein [Trebonia sp.]